MGNYRALFNEPTIRETIKKPPIPVLILSVVADKTNPKGATAFLRKPPDLDLLLKMVTRYAEHVK